MAQNSGPSHNQAQNAENNQANQQSQAPVEPPVKQLTINDRREFLSSYQGAKLKDFNLEKEEALKLFNEAAQFILKARNEKDIDMRNGLTLKAMNILKNKKIQLWLDQETLEGLRQARDQVDEMMKDKENALTDRVKQSTPNNSTFMPKPGSESYGDRISQLAKFDPNSMAFMALTDELIFLVDFVLAFSGMKLLWSQAAEFSSLKQYRPHLAYDPADYPYPEGNSEEDRKIRQSTEEALAQKQIYHYKLHNGMLDLKKESGVITDPRKITYEVAAANGLIHKPDNILAARHSVMNFWTKVVSTAPDPLYWIMKAQEREQQNRSSNQNDVRDAAQLAALQANRPSVAPKGPGQ